MVGVESECEGLERTLLLMGDLIVRLNCSGESNRWGGLAGSLRSLSCSLGSGRSTPVSISVEGDLAISRFSVDSLRLRERSLEGNEGRDGDGEAADLRTSDFPLERFSGVDSSSGLKPPRKSSSKSEEPSSACIIWRMLGCRGLLLKLLKTELSKAGVPGIFELISPFRPAMERVDE